MLPHIQWHFARGTVLWLMLCFSSVVMSYFLSSCEQESDEGENETMISYHFLSKSHNTGENCMKCHQRGANGEGWFTIAGSVYLPNLSTPNPNGKILLYTAPNGGGSVKYSIEVDGNGNFYTTNAIDFGSGLYAAHRNGRDSVQYMSEKLTSGACNSCHGITTLSIWNAGY